jgi:hypothetical protein
LIHDFFTLPGKILYNWVEEETDASHRIEGISRQAQDEVRLDPSFHGVHGPGDRGVESAELAREEEFAHLFPGCETGAMPPFGNIYGLPVYADETLKKGEEIAFNACSHTELIQIRCKDFEKLAEPKFCKFSVLA